MWWLCVFVFLNKSRLTQVKSRVLGNPKCLKNTWKLHHVIRGRNVKIIPNRLIRNSESVICFKEQVKRDRLLFARWEHRPKTSGKKKGKHLNPKVGNLWNYFYRKTPLLLQFLQAYLIIGFVMELSCISDTGNKKSLRKFGWEMRQSFWRGAVVKADVSELYLRTLIGFNWLKILTKNWFFLKRYLNLGLHYVLFVSSPLCNIRKKNN